jgi:hypothetical protein
MVKIGRGSQMGAWRERLRGDSQLRATEAGNWSGVKFGYTAKRKHPQLKAAIKQYRGDRDWEQSDL